MDNKAPNEAGVRPCLRCGKMIRVIEIDEHTDTFQKYSTFVVELDAVPCMSDDDKIAIGYEMHWPNCKEE